MTTLLAHPMIFRLRSRMLKFQRWKDLEKLKLEKELLGFFRPVIRSIRLADWGRFSTQSNQTDLDDLENKAFRLCGVVSEVERRYTKRC